MTWRDVPGWFDYADVYDKALARVPANGVMVEVGVFMGKSALYMAEKMQETSSRASFYCVDPWQITEEWPMARQIENAKQSGLDTSKMQEFGSLFRAFSWYVSQSPIADYLRVLRVGSVEASLLFDKVDFLFIDADHTYDGTAEQLEAWHSLVYAADGVIAGHDYDNPNWPGVKVAVDEFYGNRVQVMGNSWWVDLSA